jgi:hypothetical protein
MYVAIDVPTLEMNHLPARIQIFTPTCHLQAVWRVNSTCFGLLWDRGQERGNIREGRGEGESRGQGDAEGHRRKKWEGAAIHTGTQQTGGRVTGV